MNRHSLMLLTAALIFTLAACDEFGVPLTAQPTRDVQEGLAGDWLTAETEDGDHKYSRSRLRIRPYDEKTYIVEYDEALFRAWHSDTDGVPLITLQSIDSAERKYQYWTWRLSEDSRELYLRPLRSEGPMSNGLIPSDVADSATVLNIIRANREHERLYGQTIRFAR